MGENAAALADGKEVFFRNGEKMMAADVDSSDGSFRAGTPHELFRGAYEGMLGSPGFANFDAVHDGRQFLMIYSPELDTRSRSIDVVLAWPSYLARRSP